LQQAVKIEIKVQNKGYRPMVTNVIVDRISSKSAFLQSLFKKCGLNGTTVINNPFWWSEMKKFF